MGGAGKTILSLCDHSGNWPRPYADAGYEVVLVDLQAGKDVRFFEYPGRVHGILAAPPCTVFSRAGQRWKRTPEDMAAALALVDACLRIVVACRPVWGCLENPMGTLRRWLGPPAAYFDPCDFGDAWTKRTAIWGNFVMPAPLWTAQRAVAPTEGSRIHRLPGATRHDSPGAAQKKRNARSETPSGFARAFFECNP